MSNISLAEMLQRKSLPERPLRIEILRQVAAQLDQAHQRNLVHGNLNPQSILVSGPGPDGAISVFVKDFGTTFEIDPAAMSGAPPSHAYYFSPEQVLGIDLGPASDEFSFAVIAYEMIGGGLPFSAPKLSGLIFAICSDPPRPVYEFDSSLSAAVQNVFNRALAKDREGRYASCWTFVIALAAELDRSEGWQPAKPASEAIPIAAAAAVTAGPPPYIPEQSLAAPEPPEAAPEQPPFATASPSWNGRPVFEASAAPLRTDFDLPSTRRRNRYEDPEEPRPTSSPVKRFALIGLLLFALAGAAAYFFNGSRTPNLPTQVLETKNAPVTAPPVSKEPESTAPATNSTTAQQSAPVPPVTQPAPASPVPDSITPAPQTAQSQPPPPATLGETKSVSTPKAQQRAAIATHPASSGVSSGVSPGLVDVELLSEPPGADIVVDSNPALACKAPCNISLSGGRHTLSANLAGYTLAQRIFNVPENTSVFVTMPRLTGALVVTSNPSAATIVIDGKDYGLTPATLHLPPGQHRVTLMNGSQRHDEMVTVVADGIQATGYTFQR